MPGSEPPQRVASLVPSATETAFAVGAGHRLVARTFECDHPPAARDLPVVVEGVMEEGMDPAEIDAAVQAAAEEREPLHRLDVDGLVDLAPDALLTQQVCEVCAAGTPAVDRAREALADGAGGAPDVVTLEGATLDGVLEDIRRVGGVLGEAEAAGDLVAGLRDRLAAVEEAVGDRPAPRVAILEWLDPPIRAGHWVPELVERAGGEAVLGEVGGHGERITWEAVQAAEPEVVVAAPCGFGLDEAAAQAEAALEEGHLGGGIEEVVAADADAVVSRPGPRLVEGVEALASVLHPEAAPAERPGRWRRVR